MMKTIIHKAASRGTANFGWLDSKEWDLALSEYSMMT
jgi:hypothetical protein